MFSTFLILMVVFIFAIINMTQVKELKMQNELIIKELNTLKTSSRPPQGDI